MLGVCFKCSPAERVAGALIASCRTASSHVSLNDFMAVSGVGLYLSAVGRSVGGSGSVVVVVVDDAAAVPLSVSHGAPAAAGAVEVEKPVAMDEPVQTGGRTKNTPCM